MAIKIHHGPNGSYKTSGAIQDDLIPAIRAGRYIITNIRGLTRERVFQVFPDTPSTLDVVNLDLENVDDLERMRSWFHWAPRGAFVIFDEVQILFPKSWRDADVKKFDFPGGPDAAKQENRPMGWLDAWTRHRHFNWDVILTTPNISYIRDDIRMTAEKAYLHSNLAVIGVKGRYKESQHSAQDNKPSAQGSIVEIKKIRQETFKLYDSTATGSVTDTIAGKSLFRQPKLLLFLALPPILAWSAFSDMGDSYLLGNAPLQGSQVASDSVPPAVAPGQIPVHQVRSDGSNNVDTKRADATAAVMPSHPFYGSQIIVKASLRSERGLRRYLFVVRSEAGDFGQSDQQLIAAGYRIYPVGDCAVKIRFGDWESWSTCQGSSLAGEVEERLVSERRDAAGQTDSVRVDTGSRAPTVTVVRDSEYASRPWRSQTGYSAP